MTKSQLLKKIGLYDLIIYLYFLIHKMTFNFFSHSKVNYIKTNEKNLIMYKEYKKYLDIPKIIWIFWNAKLLPQEISCFVDKIKTDNPEYDLKIINFSNLADYIDDLVFIENIEIPIANKSDLIRLALLKKYGGIWLDATTILFKPLSWFLNIEHINRYDVIAFYRERSTNDFSRPVIESWFLAAPPESDYIKEWYTALEPLLTLGSKKYFEKVKARNDYSTIAQNIENPEYLLVYLAEQIVFSDCLKPFNFYLRRCETNAFHIQEAYNWDYLMIPKYLAFKDITTIHVSPIIKITSGDRHFLKFLHNKKLIRKKSILGLVFAN